MKQKIEFEIDVPEGKKVILKDNKIVFEDIKPQLPKTWEEFYSKYKGGRYFIEGNSTIKHVSSNYIFNKDVDRNMLPSEEAAKAHLALMQLHQLRDCYRQGWKPDWNKNSYKYCIIKIRNEYTINICYNSSHFLAFQSNEIAKEFLENFRDLIEQAGDLI